VEKTAAGFSTESAGIIDEPGVLAAPYRKRCAPAAPGHSLDPDATTARLIP
jgi:hypothetical protein